MLNSKSAFYFLAVFLLFQSYAVEEASAFSLFGKSVRENVYSCPAPNGFFGLVGGRCEKDYYTCVDGNAYHSLCPENGRNMARVDTWTCPAAEGFYPIPGKCTGDYYICVSGSPYVTTCPNATLFDPETRLCTNANKTSCNKPFVCPSPDGFFPTYWQCTGDYYTCVDGGAYLSHCPGTSVFEPTAHNCVAADKAPCKNASSTPHPSTASTASTTTESTTPSTTTTTTPTTTTPTTITTTRPQQFVCPQNVSGNYPYPGECTLYYACQSNGNYIVGQCPPNQAFDPVDYCKDSSLVPGCGGYSLYSYIQASRFVGLRGGPQLQNAYVAQSSRSMVDDKNDIK